MFCVKCGTAASASTKFCNNCGHNIQHRTPMQHPSGAGGQFHGVHNPNYTPSMQGPPSGPQLFSSAKGVANSLARRTPFSNKQLKIAGLSLAALIVIIIVVVKVSGNSLVGTWVLDEVLDGSSRGITVRVEFFTNGTALFDGESATWRTEGNRLIVTYTSFGITETDSSQYQISGSRLTIIFDDYGTYSRLVYIRVR